MLSIYFAVALSTAALVAASITSPSSPRTSSSLLGTSVTAHSSPPMTTGSFFSSIGAPYIYFFTSCWTQIYHPTVVGTVYVTINQLYNTTSSTTIYHEEISTDGNFTLFSRTDTDAAGTVTSAFADGQTVTYPTNYVSLFADVTWPAVVPTSPTVGSSTFMIGGKYLIKEYIYTRANGTCCIPDTTTSPIPYSTTVAGKVETIDTNDSYGWNYRLRDCSGFDEGIGISSGAQISSIWANQSLAIDYTGCAYTDCGAEYGSAAPSSFGSQVVSILATTTATISSSSQTSRVSLAETTSIRSATTSEAVAESAIISVPSTASTSNPPLSTEKAQPQATSTSSSSAGQETPEVASSSSAAKAAPTTAAIPSDAPLSSLSPITIGSTVISANSASQFIVSDQTLSPGSSITVSGTVITAPTPVPASPSLTLPLLTIGSSTVSANSASQFLVGSQTLAAGSSITVSGSVITAPTPVLPSSLSTLPPLTFGSSIITANSASQFVVGSQSLLPGQTAAVSGSVVTAPTPISASPTTSFAPIIIGGSTISASSGQYVIGSQTLAPGSQITVSGTAISLASGGTQLVVGGSTSAIATATGPGAYIWSGVGGAPSSSGPQHYLGSGSRLSLGATSLLSTLAVAVASIVISMVYSC